MTPTDETPDWPENDDRWLTWKSGPEDFAPEDTSIGSFRSREVGKQIYDDIAANLPEGATVLPNGGIKLYPDRSVEVHSNGDIFGSYKDLTWYQHEGGLSGRESADENPLQAHHLLEDNLMNQFGIDRGDGISVLLDSVDHDHFNEIPRAMPRGARPDDIDTVFHVTSGIYNDSNRPEYVDQMRQFLLDNRDSLVNQYQQGTIPGANEPNFDDRRDRVLDFLNNGLEQGGSSSVEEPGLYPPDTPPDTPPDSPPDLAGSSF